MMKNKIPMMAGNGRVEVDPRTSPAKGGTVRGVRPSAVRSGATGLPVGLHMEVGWQM